MTIEQLSHIVIFNSCAILAFNVVFSIAWFLRKRKIAINANAEYLRIRNIVQSFQFVNQPIFVTNQEGIITWVNKYAKRMFGYRQSEMIGKQIITLIAQDDWARFETFRKKPFIEDIEEALASDGNHLELTSIAKSGQKIASDVITGTWTDEEKKETYCTVLVRDISHRLRNEELRRNLENIYKNNCVLLKTGERIAKIGSWTWDMTKDPDQVTYTKGFADIFDVESGKAFPAKYLMEIVDIEDRDRVNECLRIATLENKGYDITYRIGRRNNRKDLIRCVAEPELNANRKTIKINGVIFLLKEDVE